MAKMAWEYCNVKVATEVARLDTDDAVREMLSYFGILYDAILDASTGRSPFGPWEEGYVDYLAGNQLCGLAYDFVVEGDMAIIFRMDIQEGL